MESARWLNDEEQATWRSFMLAEQLIWEQIDRQLQQDAGMPHAYYSILVALSETPDRRLRMTELARRLHYSPSRLAHAIRNLENEGWILRENCPQDKRGYFANLTELGMKVLVEAAPGHVGEVRRLIFDQLNDDEVRQLGAILEKVAAGIEISPENRPAAK